jgi:REP element-mobilizing transposase RayT
MRRFSQSPLLPGLSFKQKLSFGGKLSSAKGNPKTKRPLAAKQGMHLVLKSSRAQGKYSFLRFSKDIESILRKQASNFGVKIYDFANAGNHLHLVIRIHNRETYKSFIRAISGLLMRKVFGLERGRGAHSALWDARPFTRILTWGKDFSAVKNYLHINRLEMIGLKREEARATIKKHGLKTSLLGIGFSPN